MTLKILIIGLWVLGFVACSPQTDSTPNPPQPAVQQQPVLQTAVSAAPLTQVVASQPAPQDSQSPTQQANVLPANTIPAVSDPPKPTSTIACTDNLTFVADLTVPDGSYIARLSDVDKRWQVRNTGTCNWDERYHLVLVAGSELGVPKEQALYPARSGAEAMIRLLLKAPDIPGVYTSAWQAFNPVGEPFGDVIYIEFQVN